MLNNALVVAIVVMTLLLAAFIYQIVTTLVPAVDAPTLSKAAQAPAPPVPARPAGHRPAPTVRARAGVQPGHTADAIAPASGASPPGALGRLRPWVAAALMIAGLALGLTGGSLLLHTAQGACAHHAIQVCSQGYVVLTGTQLGGGALALAGIALVFTGGALALR
jgi:hypothetical protein